MESEMSEGSQIDDFMQQSTFTFVGRVKELNASAAAEIPATSSTAVVTVDEVLQAPPMFTDLDGSDITIQLSSPQQVVEGQQVTFFTVGLTYGTSLAVQEIGHVEGRADVGLAGEIAALGPTTSENQSTLLRQHIADADIVLTGMVSGIKFPEGFDPYGPASEHAARWREATIIVESVEKGNLSDDTVTAFYAASGDMQWYRTPTLEVGQNAIFVLNKREIQDLQTEGYALLDALDVHPRQEYTLIQTLIGQSSG